MPQDSTQLEWLDVFNAYQAVLIGEASRVDMHKLNAQVLVYRVNPTVVRIDIKEPKNGTT